LLPAPQLIQVRCFRERAAQTSAIENVQPTFKRLEPMMKTVTYRNVVFLAMALAAATLTGCADVHQNPASSAVTSDAPASQAANAPSPTNVPF
jgi:7-cyano-7-deazaguanine synthase in queuosine biosynthesis